MEFNKLKNRALSVFGLVMINVIAIDSLRNLPTNAKTGFAVAFYYLVVGLLFMLPCVLVTAELATNYPKTGGTYVWVREAFGRKWGFLNIWLQWIYNVVWYPLILSFIAVNIAYLFSPNLASNKTYLISMIIGMFAFATLVNGFGMKTSSMVSALSAIVGTIVPMLLIIGLGLSWLIAHKPLAITPTWHDFFPHIGKLNNLAFIVIVIFSLMGLEMSAVHAGDVKNPQRDYPRALLISSVIILVTMILASVAIALVVPQTDLNIISGIDQAGATFLNAFHLHWLFPILIVLIILGGFGGMSAWVIGPTKGLMIAADDHCLPAMFRKRNRRGVPVVILIAQLVIVIGLCSLINFVQYISTSYWILSDLTAQLALLFYVLLFAAAIKLRYKNGTKANTFRIPGGRVGIWVVGLMGIGTCLGAIGLGFLPPSGVKIIDVSRYEIILVVGIVLLTLPPFVFFRVQNK